MKKLILPILILLSLPLLFQSTPTEIIKLKTFDALIKTPEPSGNFVILNITEEDVEREGGYPLPRQRLAEIQLDIIQDVNELDQTETLLSSELDLKGTTFGFDQDTQVNTFTTDSVLTFVRALENTVRLDLDKSGAYTVILIQNGKSTQIVVNGGGSSTITIKQGS